VLDPSVLPRRSLPVAAVAAVLVLWAAPAAPASGAPAAPGDPVAAKRAEAAQIADELARRRDEVSALTEDLNVARLEAAARTAEAAAAAEELRRAEAQVGEARIALKRRLVAAYAAGGPPTVIVSVLVGGPAEEMARRRTYANAVAGEERGDIDDLDAAIEVLDARRDEVAAAEAAAGEVLAQVEVRRRAAEEAAAGQRATLDRVNGELAGLVEQERARRAEEEARRAKAELEARQAREQAAARVRQAAEAAARAATTTTSARGPTTTRPSMPSTASSAPAASTGVEPAPAEPPRPPAAGAELAVAEARNQLGKPYVYGSGGPDSFDCSGLTSHAWRAAGKTLPHSSRAQMEVTVRVPVGELQPGDLIFYGTPVHHVGIYAGGGQMVEASETGTPVRMASIYRRDLVGVGRVK